MPRLTKSDREFLRAVAVQPFSPQVAEESDDIIRFLRRHRIPVTRASYLYIAYLGNPPELDGETEAELPEFLQDDDT